jgi:hypothetical protein
MRGMVTFAIIYPKHDYTIGLNGVYVGFVEQQTYTELVLGTWRSRVPVSAFQGVLISVLIAWLIATIAVTVGLWFWAKRRGLTA